MQYMKAAHRGPTYHQKSSQTLMMLALPYSPLCIEGGQKDVLLRSTNIKKSESSICETSFVVGPYSQNVTFQFKDEEFLKKVSKNLSGQLLPNFVAFETAFFK